MRKSNKFSTAFILVVLWVLLALGAALEFGFWPKTVKGGLLLVLAGPIAFLVLSAVGEMLGEGFDRLPGIRHARDFIEKKPRARVFRFYGFFIVWVKYSSCSRFWEESTWFTSIGSLSSFKRIEFRSRNSE